MLLGYQRSPAIPALRAGRCRTPGVASSSDLCLLHRGRDAAPLPAPWLTANCGVGHRPLSRRPHHRPSPQPARLTARHHRLSRRSAILLRPVQSVLTSAVRLELVSMPAVISAHQLPNEAIPTTKNPIHFIIPFECRPFAWPFLQAGHRWRTRAYPTRAH